MRSSLLCPFAVAALVLLTSQLLFSGVARNSVAGDTLAYALLFAVEDQALLDQPVLPDAAAKHCPAVTAPVWSSTQDGCTD